MSKLRSVCTSLALVFFGFQICQYGLIPSMIDYESIHMEAASLPRTAPPAAQKLLLETKASSQAVERVEVGGSAELAREEVKTELTQKAFAASDAAEEVEEKAVPETTTLIQKEEERVEETTILLVYDNSQCDGPPTETAEAEGLEPVVFTPAEFPMSAKVEGGGMAEVFIRERQYQGVLMEGDECFRFPTDMRNTNRIQFSIHTPSSQTTSLTAKRQIPESLQQQFSTAKDMTQPHTKIVFSVQSTHYFGYQVLANAYAFLHSNQTNASWIRLLTSRKPDDLSERFPTFSAPKSLYMRTYNPINKADVIIKWFLSKDRPHPDDTIVVVDPDSWLLKDLHPWTMDVSAGNAIGQKAYYHGQNVCQKLWKEICLESCDRKLDLVGVPYLLKASDLEAVAPLWKKYSLIVKIKLEQEDFKNKFGHMGFEWAAEMIGYNAACAHLKINTKVVNSLQVRDIESNPIVGKWSKMASIHVGRAWFPLKDEALAAPWRDEDDGGTNREGEGRIQVWCKCNATAGEQQPWPIPTKGMDFVSKHTLTILHDSVQQFGPVPVNESFRVRTNYYLPTE